MPDAAAQPGAPARAPSLDDRYLLERGPVYLTGVQALVRLAYDQARRDRAAGLRTGTFISGYPGSPLGGYDLALARTRALHGAHGIVHRPAGNEEQAATALMGTQLLDRYPHQRCDGVVGFWYGKGPGLDRAGDAIRHGNFAGVSRHGAVVVLSGEDHEAKSSTMPFAQESYFVHAGMPVLYPGTVAEFLTLGLHAAALSRYSGLWVALKLVNQLCDGGQTLEVDPARPAISLPDFTVGGRPFEKRQYHRFFPVETVETERLLHAERLPAAVAYARHNRLDRVELSGPGDRLALVAAGKSFTDLRQALSDLGLDDAALGRAGVRLVRFGMIHPLDRAFAAEALGGLPRAIVVEEKRGFLEAALRDALYALPARPEVLGKRDERGAPMLPDFGGMDADLLAQVLAPHLLPLLPERREPIERRLAELRQAAERPAAALQRRAPNYCSGCPHNVSLRVLPGQVAWSAPGCHVFATLMEQPERRADATFPLGGEGLAWIGLAPFTDRQHIIQNQGDGGLFHSGYLNVRFAVAAGARMTFRILYNGAVANTGAQKPVGQKDVPTLVKLLALEGVKRIAVVARDPSAYRGVEWPAVARVHGRDEIEPVLRELEAVDGVTVFLYDGECANERRRQEKRALREPSHSFVVVNEAVCENCGHCGASSNCMSLHKVETELGEKTRIHQASCTQDRLCLTGDCPAFVTVEVEGGARRHPPLPPLDDVALPEPALPPLTGPWRALLPGVGGTGVVTVNALLCWAAFLDGREVLSFDQTGAAQKWGSVLSSLVVAPAGQAPPAARIGLGQADLLLALDLMAGADRQHLARCRPDRTAAVIHSTLLPSGEMIRDVHLDPGAARLDEAIAAVCDPARTVRVEARRLAEELLGDPMAANVIAVGVAFQAGFLPLSSRALTGAIQIDGTAVEQNLRAFRLGRVAVHDPARVAAWLAPAPPAVADPVEREAATLGGDADGYRALLAGAAGLDPESRRLLAFRAAELVRFQDLALARRYVAAVLEVAVAERERLGPLAEPRVTRAVIRGLHKLLAYKDEYEVARLHLAAGMAQRAGETFTGRTRIRYQLHPPVLRALGMRRKLSLGRWIEPLLRLLVALRGLRGTALDPFGGAAVRRLERELPGWYAGLVAGALPHLEPATQGRVAELLSLPEEIRGYEELKLTSAERARARAEELLRELRGGAASRAAS
ncbi:MAG: indolepyruvate ferredoxin oxidoreductase family protein [Deltaproteobacteria bacterium]|nr:indolepyruvate ferredoxin oxidoreductase family protein [Deltaproteobacteria bacterium]